MGQPGEERSHGWFAGCSRSLASGILINFGDNGSQYIPLIITLEYGAICFKWNY